MTHLPWCSKKVRVAVVGDLMLDEYLDGTVTRISPEAPVPVLHVRSTRLVPGGAANVARNVQLVGGDATLFGAVGRDHAGGELKRCLAKDGVDISPVIGDSTVETVRKTRVTADHHQIVRVDWESIKPISQRLQDMVYEEMRMTPWDAILISDYGKGGMPHSLIRRIISLGRSRGVPVVVDPKGRDFSPYEGCTLITPNRKEAVEAIGRDPGDTLSIARLVSEIARSESVLVTLGAEGMAGLAADGSFAHIPTVAVDVFDVSGAGDTVAAVMALALASGQTLRQSMVLANAAAGKVVGKWGTQPILREELEDALRPKRLELASKVLSAADLTAALETPRGKIVFTNGCFDLLHVGHVSLLQRARALGDFLVVAVNSDASVAALKGQGRPINTARDRCEILAALGCVDAVVEFSEKTPLSLIEAVKPHVLVKGGDYRHEDIVGADFVERNGGKTVMLDLVADRSTTLAVDKIRGSSSASESNDP